MICEATYDSFESIPEAHREEFEQVNGKWQLKPTAIPGVGPLFNASLAANERKAVDQVKTRNTKIKELEIENNRLTDKLAILDSPGNKVLSKADADTFDNYAKLGTPKEIEEKLKATEELAGKVTRFETADSLQKVAKANGLGDVALNPEVLSDWLASPENKGLTVFTKTEERTDTKGAKTQLEVPYVRIEEQKDGKTNVSEKELLTFAKEAMPEWKYTALVAGSPATETGKGVKPLAPATTGVKVPNLGSARKEPGEDGDKKRPVDKFNEQRASRPSPFAKPAGMVGTVPPVR